MQKKKTQYSRDIGLIVFTVKIRRFFFFLNINLNLNDRKSFICK